VGATVVGGGEVGEGEREKVWRRKDGGREDGGGRAMEVKRHVLGSSIPVFIQTTRVRSVSFRTRYDLPIDRT